MKIILASKKFIKDINFFALLFILISISFSCATISKDLEPPRVHVIDIQVQEVRALEAVLRIELRVMNVNDIEVEVKGIDCELEINGKHFASGVTDQKTKIPAYGTTVVPMVVYSSVLDVVRGVLGIKEKEKIEYKITGRLHLEGDIMVPSSIRFQSEGELSLEGLIQTK
jgi:LEA14-like dessication related protein